VGCLQCFFVCCSVRCSVWTHDGALFCGVSKDGVILLQRAAVLIVCSSVLQCAAVCCSVLQCVAFCCSVCFSMWTHSFVVF